MKDKPMGKETVIIFKDNQSREIHTYVHLGGLGARQDLSHFISKVAEFYGSPATTLTRKAHLARLLKAADQAILDMKQNCREVAAINLERPVTTAS